MKHITTSTTHGLCRGDIVTTSDGETMKVAEATSTSARLRPLRFYEHWWQWLRSWRFRGFWRRVWQR